MLISILFEVKNFELSGPSVMSASAEDPNLADIVVTLVLMNQNLDIVGSLIRKVC